VYAFSPAGGLDAYAIMANASIGGRNRMSGVGVAIPASSMDDHFVLALVQGLADPLIAAGMSLITKVVPDEESEERAYRHWAKAGDVSGVVLLGLGPDDPRVAQLRSLAIPLAAVVDATVPVDVPAVVVDSDASIAVLQAFLETRPPRRTVYITGPADRPNGSSRPIAMEPARIGDAFEVIRTEHNAEAAVAVALECLSAGPATLVFDSDVHAAAALAAVRADGLAVPDDVSIVSWTNSVLCQSASRSITAIDRRGGEIGVLLGERMLAAIAGEPAARVPAPGSFVVVGETA
jgi:DNA-binding LacI/PurR family transcriptional regulator